MNALVQNAMKGDHLAIARLISLIERGGLKADDAMRVLHKKAGKAHIVGVTGVAGSGKSTLIGSITHEFRKQNKKVGIIAIDPTSPFSGGALLGDRVRMTGFTGDDGVFIRSMATHGTKGGLSKSIRDVVFILDVCFADVVIVETVGVGQDEVDIVKVVDTTIVIEVPGLGDSIQMIKAGIMEIGDIIVVNKSDLPSADHTFEELSQWINNRPILKTSAKQNTGIRELVEEINKHREDLDEY